MHASDESKTESVGLEPIKLIEPKLERDTSLAEAFRARRTVREFSDEALSPQTLSDLLWAAAKQSAQRSLRRRRTHGCLRQQLAGNRRLCRAERGNLPLRPSAAHPRSGRGQRLPPLRARCPPGAGGANAPVRLIYVADIGKLEHTAGFEEPGLHDPEVQQSYYYVDTGLIAGNVYLFAASRGLAAWFHNCDRAALSEKFGLDDGRRPLFGQTVGYPRRTGPMRPEGDTPAPPA